MGSLGKERFAAEARITRQKERGSRGRQMICGTKQAIMKLSPSKGG